MYNSADNPAPQPPEVANKHEQDHQFSNPTEHLWSKALGNHPEESNFCFPQ